MKKFIYGKNEYRYIVDFQKRKTLALTIHPSKSIILAVPEKTKIKEIENFLKRKSFWIDKQLEFFNNFKNNVAEKEYISGESFLYLGKRYMLKVEKSEKNKVILRQGKLLILSENPENQEFNKNLLND
jgi:predicted metal-dependent hydrolase